VGYRGSHTEIYAPLCASQLPQQLPLFILVRLVRILCVGIAIRRAEYSAVYASHGNPMNLQPSFRDALVNQRYTAKRKPVPTTRTSISNPPLFGKSSWESRSNSISPANSDSCGKCPTWKKMRLVPCRQRQAHSRTALRPGREAHLTYLLYDPGGRPEEGDGSRRTTISTSLAAGRAPRIAAIILSGESLGPAQSDCETVVSIFVATSS